jgi:FAD/FMN-containing dehydrogenase
MQLILIESSFMVVQHTRAKDLDASFEMLTDKVWDDHYTVAWIDCLSQGRKLGRSVLMRGHHAKVDDLPVSTRARPFAKSQRQYNLGFDFPSWVLNSASLRAFNELYYYLQSRRTQPFISDYESFFFPLDRIGNWNRMYGKRGFVQYQCVLPSAEARAGMQALLEELSRARRSSFLSVLKRFGPAGSGLLSFPIEGYTLTLDLPVSDAELFPFLDRLDEIVLKHGGRVYLAKDARLRPETFRAMYPRLNEWSAVKSQVDPENKFDSDLARRLEIGVR